MWPNHTNGCQILLKGISLIHQPRASAVNTTTCQLLTKILHAEMCAATTAQHRESLSPELEAKFGEFVSANPQPQIILGTQSASRRAVVDELAQQFSFKVSSITADIDEKAIRTPDPKELVMMLAHAKADAIMKKLKDSGSMIRPGYLVTCDQV
jgi:hypothetical protein